VIRSTPAGGGSPTTNDRRPTVYPQQKGPFHVEEA
jgi:hypothetical protein